MSRPLPAGHSPAEEAGAWSPSRLLSRVRKHSNYRRKIEGVHAGESTSDRQRLTGHRPSLQAGCQGHHSSSQGVKGGSNKPVCDSPNHGSPKFGLQET